jgi:hypothetical protein
MQSQAAGFSGGPLSRKLNAEFKICSSGERRLEYSLASKVERLLEPSARWVLVSEWMLLVLLAAQMGVRTLPEGMAYA